MNVIILAGGFGTRLRHLLPDICKPMAPVRGRPFLEYILLNLAKYHPESIILCVSYLREQIIKYFGGSFRGIPVSYSIEETPLGTGGAIWQAFEAFNLREALILNGDTFVDADFDAFTRLSAGKDLCMMLAKVDDATRYGTVVIEDGRITGFREKSAADGGGLINAGIYYLNRKCVPPMPESFSFEKDFLVPGIARLNPAYHIHRKRFIDIGVPEDYRRAEFVLPEIWRKE